ncbi:MAG: M48 family metallopeptidase [Deltaproteobacteria bacterium]|nr:M48 family metallopeptidase [Deltaproteobacteria bacterium]
MSAVVDVGGVQVEVVRKAIKNLHLSVLPPAGKVRIAAPARMTDNAIRLFVISKLAWIRGQQATMQGQEREPPREFLERESHYVWGKRYLLKLEEWPAAPTVELGHHDLVLSMRPGASPADCADVLDRWYREQLRVAVRALRATWEPRIGVRAEGVYVQRMKTKWGSCNPRNRTIRLNTELAKKPVECVEYVLVHELAHLIEANHGDRFRAVLDRVMPGWEETRAELNRGPVGHEDWEY